MPKQGRWSKIDTTSILLAMSGRNFSLTEHLSGFIDSAVRNGRHQNASEVVREALRRYEDDLKAEEASLAAIRAVVDQGAAAIERGDFVTIRSSKDRQDLLRRLSRKSTRAK